MKVERFGDQPSDYADVLIGRLQRWAIRRCGRQNFALFAASSDAVSRFTLGPQRTMFVSEVLDPAER